MKYSLLFLSFVVMAITGCGGNSTDPANSNSSNNNSNNSNDPKTQSTERTIGISVQTLQNPFFKVIAETVEAEAGKQGWKVLKRDAEEKIEVQKDQVNDFIVKKVDAIILCPRDSAAIGSAVKKANDAGIPVFTVDTVCDDSQAKVAFHVGTDNFQGGEVAGQAMLDALGERGGKVAILEFKDVDSCIDRVKGFMKVIDAYNQQAANQIEIVGYYDSRGNDELGQKTAREAMVAAPDLAGIFAINDPAALGAYFAIKSEGKTDQIVVVGFDGQPIGKIGVRDGKLFDTPTQFPDKMAREVVKAIQKYFDGDEIEPKSMFIKTAPYRKADADQDASLPKSDSSSTSSDM